MLNAKREAVPVSTSVSDEVVIISKETEQAGNETADSFEVLDDSDVAEAGVYGLGLGIPRIQTHSVSSAINKDDHNAGANLQVKAIARSRSPSPSNSPSPSFRSLNVPPSEGRASPNLPKSRSPSSSPQLNHSRKSSLSQAIAGAFVSREKSPGPNKDRDRLNKKVSDKQPHLPPPVASKPSWLKRTASAGKVMITGVSGSRDPSPTASPLGPGPPPLPSRERISSISKSERSKKAESMIAPSLPRRHSPSASISIASTAQRNGPRDLLPLAKGGNEDKPKKVVSRAGKLTTAASFEEKMLPPPARASVILPSVNTESVRGHHSLDVPRTLASIGTNGPTVVKPVAAGLRSGLGVVNRRIGAWSQETGAGSNAKTYLQAGGGAIGSVVSSGWSAFRGNGKNYTPPASTSSGLSSANSKNASNAYFPSASGSGALGINGMDGPNILPELIKRTSTNLAIKGLVFGRDLAEVAQDWPISDNQEFPIDATKTRKPRERSLPSVAVRCVDHLCIWAPQEEGIFRVSGRSSHIALLRKHFDSGADVDLEPSDPGDIDPHSVASLYKSFLRELPTPILTGISGEFDDFMKTFNGSSAQDQEYLAAIGDAMAGQANLLNLGKRDKDAAAAQAAKRQSLLDEMRIQMMRLLRKLPDENWWLLSDLSRLLSLTDEHRAINKMTMQNLLMVFCPSLNLSPPFMRYLVENRSALFRDADVPISTPRSSIILNSPIVPVVVIPPSPAPLGPSKADNITRTRPISQDASVVPPQNRSKINIPEAFTNETEQAGSMDKKFSTPIADKFARTGPVEINLRDTPSRNASPDPST